MGNCSASATFDVVADALLDEAVNGERLVKILVPLIHHLDNDDWDCQGESISTYADNPWIQEAFKRTGHKEEEVDEPSPPVPDAQPRPAGTARPAPANRRRSGGRAGPG